MISQPRHLYGCPECGSSSIAKILYGLPILDDTLQKQIDAKEVVLGGCVLSPESRRWECNRCGHRFGEIDLDAPYDEFEDDDEDPDEEDLRDA